MNNNFGGFDKQKLLGLLNAGGNQNLKGALESGDLQKVMSSLNPQDAERVREILNNPDAINKLLSSPQAAELLKKLM